MHEGQDVFPPGHSVAQFGGERLQQTAIENLTVSLVNAKRRRAPSIHVHMDMQLWLCGISES